MWSAMDNECWKKNDHVTVNATVNFAKCRSLVVQTASPGYKVISCRCSVDTSSMFVCVCVCGGDEGRHRVVV